MSWRFRRSIRLPGGIRINVSRRGLGYSWGVPGVHFGRDANGRHYQAYSVPGTGIYSRSYSKGERVAPSGTGSFWKLFGFGIFLGMFPGLLRVIRKSPGCGCLLLLGLLALPLMFLRYVISFVQEIPIPLLVAAGIVSIIVLGFHHFEIQVQKGDDAVTSTDLAGSQTSVQPLATEAPSAAAPEGNKPLRADSSGSTTSHIHSRGAVGMFHPRPRVVALAQALFLRNGRQRCSPAAQFSARIRQPILRRR